MTTASPILDHTRAARSGAGGSRVLRGIVFILAPAVLAVVCLRYFVPTPAEAEGSLAFPVAVVGSEYPIPLAVAFFLLWSMLARYWARQFPGAAWLVEQRLSLPAASLPMDASRDDRVTALRARERRRAAAAVAVAAVAGLSAFLLRTHLLTPYRVLSTSMLPTLLPGDFLAANRLAYGFTLPGSEQVFGAKEPQRGDVVVFRGADADAAPLVKRVIGLPGDRVAMVGSRPVVNGWEAPTCDAGLYLFALPEGAVKARLLVEFMDDQAYLTIAAPPPREFFQPYDVQPGEVFVLGDNRNNSSDSRAWNDGRGGGLALDRIEAQARWFIVGKRRDQRADLSRLLESVSSTRLHLEGIDTTALREGIAKCLEQWPQSTRVPLRGTGQPLSAPPVKILGE